MVLHGVTCMVLHAVSWCYMILQGVTMVLRCFMVCHVNTLFYTVLHGFTRCHIVLQGVT